MSVVRLEKFTHSTTGNMRPKFISPLELEAIRQESYEKGIRKGAEAASEAYSTEQSRCLGAIRESMTDADFSTQEAHRQALLSLRPLICALVDTIVPAVGRSGLTAEIADVVVDITTNSTAQSIKIGVSPAMYNEISDIFATNYAEAVVFSNPDLSELQSQVHWADGFTEIDLSNISTLVKATITTFFEQVELTQKPKVNYGNY